MFTAVNNFSKISPHARRWADSTSPLVVPINGVEIPFLDNARQTNIFGSNFCLDLNLTSSRVFSLLEE